MSKPLSSDNGTPRENLPYSSSYSRASTPVPLGLASPQKIKSKRSSLINSPPSEMTDGAQGVSAFKRLSRQITDPFGVSLQFDKFFNDEKEDEKPNLKVILLFSNKVGDY
jgi:hypothetical protein